MLMRRRPRRHRKLLNRHSRNAVMAAVAFVLSSLIGFAALAAAQNAWLRDPLYADKADRLVQRIAAKTESGQPPISIVMLGSSRTSNALRGTDLESQLASVLNRPIVAFNFGVPSSGPVTQLLHLRRLLDSGVRPSLVLFEIMPPLLSNQTRESIEHHFHAPERLLPGEAGFVTARGYPADKFLDAERLTTWLPIYGMRLAIVGRYFPNWSPWNRRFDSSRNSDETGWMKPVFDPVTPEQYAAGVDWAKQEYAAWLHLLRLDGHAAAAVHESIAVSRNAGVPIALIILPEGTQFRQMYTPESTAELDRFLKSFAATRVIDARQWLPDSGFSDSHHMISAGSRQFTERLGRELIAQELLTGALP